MSEYILPHQLAGERQRLELMSQLLDPLHRRAISSGSATNVLATGSGSAP
jgi:hypothetical protein